LVKIKFLLDNELTAIRGPVKIQSNCVDLILDEGVCLPVQVGQLEVIPIRQKQFCSAGIFRQVRLAAVAVVNCNVTLSASTFVGA
jgi:hypothetical protein